MNINRRVVALASGAVLIAGGGTAAGILSSGSSPASPAATSSSSVTISGCVGSNGAISGLTDKGKTCPSASPYVQWGAKLYTSVSPTPSPTSPSPTPTPTATSPSPTPTSTSPAAWACTAVGMDCSEQPFTTLAGGRQQPYVVQNVFSGAASGQQLQANSMSDWQVTDTLPGGTQAVQSYPAAKDDLDLYSSATGLTTPDPLTSFGSFTSTYATTLPSSPGSSDSYEAAYDFWLGSTAQPSWKLDEEVMVWTDTVNCSPAGSDTGKVYTASDGTVYEIWVLGGSNTASSTTQTISLVRKANTSSGTLDILALVKWMQANGYANTSAIGFDQMDYGFEVRSTSGLKETFAVTNYNLAGSTTATSNIIRSKPRG